MTTNYASLSIIEGIKLRQGLHGDSGPGGHCVRLPRENNIGRVRVPHVVGEGGRRKATLVGLTRGGFGLKGFS